MIIKRGKKFYVEMFGKRFGSRKTYEEAEALERKVRLMIISVEKAS